MSIDTCDVLGSRLIWLDVGYCCDVVDVWEVWPAVISPALSQTDQASGLEREQYMQPTTRSDTNPTISLAHALSLCLCKNSDLHSSSLCAGAQYLL